VDELKVAVFLPYRLDADGSVGKKYGRMLRIWSDLGVNVRGFVLGRDRVWPDPFIAYPVPPGEWHRHRGAVRLARLLSAWAPDVTYTRFSLFIPGLRRALGRAPLVEEINTNDRVELPMWSPGAGWYHRVTRRWAFADRAGYVFLTSELAEVTALRSASGRSVVIPNGADLDSVQPLPARGNDRPRVLFLAGSPSPWQGIDKVLRLAELRPDLDVDLVGDLALDHVVPPNVTVHGFASGDRLIELCSVADIALGTLALHRKAMQEACPLKVREYLALGIPTVIGYRDPDLVGLDRRFVLEIPNEEGNVEGGASEIAAFAYASRGVRVPREAISHLSWRHKEEQRLAFFRSVLGTSEDCWP
jgi:glycosyltransferase involved in cell wall biosynthesis